MWWMTHCPNLFWERAIELQGRFSNRNDCKKKSLTLTKKQLLCVLSFLSLLFFFSSLSYEQLRWTFLKCSSPSKGVRALSSQHSGIFLHVVACTHPAPSLWISAVKHTPRDSRFTLNGLRFFNNFESTVTWSFIYLSAVPHKHITAENSTNCLSFRSFRPCENHFCHITLNYESEPNHPHHTSAESKTSRFNTWMLKLEVMTVKVK